MIQLHNQAIEIVKRSPVQFLELILSIASIFLGIWFYLFGANTTFPLYAALLKMMDRWGWALMFIVVGISHMVIALDSYPKAKSRIRVRWRSLSATFNAGVWFWILWNGEALAGPDFWQAPSVPLAMLIAIGWSIVFLRIEPASSYPS